MLDTKYFSITYPDTNVATTEDPGLMFVKGMDLIYVFMWILPLNNNCRVMIKFLCHLSLVKILLYPTYIKIVRLNWILSKVNLMSLS